MADALDLQDDECTRAVYALFGRERVRHDVSLIHRTLRERRERSGRAARDGRDDGECDGAYRLPGARAEGEYSDTLRDIATRRCFNCSKLLRVHLRSDHAGASVCSSFFCTRQCLWSLYFTSVDHFIADASRRRTAYDR